MAAKQTELAELKVQTEEAQKSCSELVRAQAEQKVLPQDNLVKLPVIPGFSSDVTGLQCCDLSYVSLDFYLEIFVPALIYWALSVRLLQIVFTEEQTRSARRKLLEDWRIDGGHGASMYGAIGSQYI